MEYLNVQNTWNKISKDDIVDIICLLENPNETNVSKDYIIKKLKDVLDFNDNVKIIRFDDVFNELLPPEGDSFLCSD